MPTVTVSAVVAAPIGEVWRIVGDLNAHSRWNTLHVGFPVTLPEPVGVGTTFTQTLSTMGMSNDVVWTVSAVEDERVLELRGKAPMNVSTRLRYHLAAAPEGTKVTIENEFAGAAVALMAGRVKKGAAAEMRTSLDRLAGLVR
jgi:hypothetical protein